MNNDEIFGIVKTAVDEILASSSEKIVFQKDKITLDMAQALSLAVRKKAEEIGVKAVIAISNSGANPVLINAMDESYIASFDIALKKAYTVVALKMPTSKLKKLSQPGESLYGIQFTNNGQIVIFGGGEPLYIGDTLVGGLGVSGGTEEEDTYLSEYGKTVFEKIAEEFNK